MCLCCVQVPLTTIMLCYLAIAIAVRRSSRMWRHNKPRDMFGRRRPSVPAAAASTTTRATLQVSLPNALTDSSFDTYCTQFLL